MYLIILCILVQLLTFSNNQLIKIPNLVYSNNDEFNETAHILEQLHSSRQREYSNSQKLLEDERRSSSINLGPSHKKENYYIYTDVKSTTSPIITRWSIGVGLLTLCFILRCAITCVNSNMREINLEDEYRRNLNAVSSNEDYDTVETCIFHNLNSNIGNNDALRRDNEQLVNNDNELSLNHDNGLNSNEANDSERESLNLAQALPESNVEDGLDCVIVISDKSQDLDVPPRYSDYFDYELPNYKKAMELLKNNSTSNDNINGVSNLDSSIGLEQDVV